MTCRGVLDALSDYIEGDAGKSVCKKIEEHLEGCVRCRMHVDAMRKMVYLYKKWRDDPIPEDVKMRLQDVFARECLPEGKDRTGNLEPGGASAASDGGRHGKARVSSVRRRPTGRKHPKASKRAPRKR